MFTASVIGRPVKDLELQTSSKGNEYVRFKIAINKGFGDNEKALFVSCVLFDKEAQRIINAKVKKGSLIHVVGDFDSDTTVKDGKTYVNHNIQVFSWCYIPNGFKKEGEEENKEDNNQNYEEDINTQYEENDLPF